jgi:hypothetical protein
MVKSGRDSRELTGSTRPGPHRAIFPGSRRYSSSFRAFYTVNAFNESRNRMDRPSDPVTVIKVFSSSQEWVIIRLYGTARSGIRSGPPSSVSPGKNPHLTTVQEGPPNLVLGLLWLTCVAGSTTTVGWEGRSCSRWRN